MNLVFPGAGHLITTHRGWGIWSLVSISYYVALIPRGVINHGGDKPWCIQSERYPIRGGLAEKQRLAQALLCIWRYVRVLSIKPCLHTQLLEHNRSYWKGSRGRGHLITWNGPIMGHLNSFTASGGGNLNKNFPKIQMSRGLPGGGGCLSFDLTGTLHPGRHKVTWTFHDNEVGRVRVYSYRS